MEDRRIVSETKKEERLMKRALLALFSLFLVNSNALAESEAVKELNGLLEGEMSAVETYRQAMKQVTNAELEKALKNHEMAVTELRNQVTNAGGTPVSSSGLWGTWTKTVEGTAKAISNETALKALREGEQHGIDEYHEALKDKAVPEPTKDLIRSKYLPNQQTHLDNLNKIISKS